MLFVAPRFERLAELLDWLGYELIARIGKEVSQWNELERVDPATGLVDIRARLILEQAGHDELPVRLTELWVHGTEPGFIQEQGHSLVSYAYHQQAGNHELRYCLNDHRPTMPYHVHRTGQPAPVAHGPILVKDALVRFQEFVANEIQVGNFVALSAVPGRSPSSAATRRVAPEGLGGAGSPRDVLSRRPRRPRA